MLYKYLPIKNRIKQYKNRLNDKKFIDPNVLFVFYRRFLGPDVIPSFFIISQWLRSCEPRLYGWQFREFSGQVILVFLLAKGQ